MHAATFPFIVSAATLRAADLVPAFLLAIDELDQHAHARLAHIHAPTIHALEHGRIDGADDDVAWLMEELTDTLDALAPAGYYFGTHEGDGALFGFWQC